MDADETVVADGIRRATMVAEPKAKPDRKKREVPRYHVILWDSDAHTYEYVERMLRELFGHTPEDCHKMAEKVDTRRPRHRADDDQGACGAEAGPDSRLRQGRQYSRMQGIDASTIEAASASGIDEFRIAAR